jgi:Carboxypeptidase regulatory-like domain
MWWPMNGTRRWSVGFVLVASLLLTGCDGYTGVKGKVSDQTGKPMPDAVIRLERLSGGRHDEVHSGNDGTYTVGMTNAPILAERVRIVVTKPGYGTVTHEFAPNQMHTYDVLLVPATN